MVKNIRIHREGLRLGSRGLPNVEGKEESHCSNINEKLSDYEGRRSSNGETSNFLEINAVSFTVNDIGRKGSNR
jgi:hypothetical protein